MDSLDLLFAQVEDVSHQQTQIQVNQDLTARAVDQVIQDQSFLTKQIEETGKAVAQLRLQCMREDKSDAGWVESEPGAEVPQKDHRHTHRQVGEQYPHRSATGRFKDVGDGFRQNRGYTPKLQFPKFSGTDPKVWLAHYEDYFQILNVPEPLCVITASASMEGNAAKWGLVQRRKGGFTTWAQFRRAVEDKFGTYDYLHALGDLLELTQQGTTEDYVAAF
jgi:hypothetical protein